MNDSNNRFLMVLSLLLLIAWGCGSDDSESNAEQMADGAVSPDQGLAMTDASNEEVDPLVFTPNADCEFDEAQAGKGPGKQIENFISEQYNGSVDDDGQEVGVPFHFQSFCGGGSEVVWVFLTTGWCGACESYAERALSYLQEHQGSGLRIVWIVGEDGEYNPPSRDYMIQYRRNKLDRDNDGMVSEAEGSLPFVIVRDNDFNNTRRFIDPSAAGTSLPRQYVLDGSNMLVQFASDPNAMPPRPFIQGECEMLKLVGALQIESCEGYTGE